jgi:ATP-binding cassette subfamily B protein
MKILLRVAKEARKYRWLLIIAILGTIALTAVNLIAPRLLAQMVSIVAGGMTREGLKNILQLAAILLGLYASRILFRFLSNYLAHKAAWLLVQELRIKVYNKLQSFSIGYYHNKQTGDLMSRVITDTETFEQLYSHIIPETISNALTVVGVTTILLFIDWKLALLTTIPIPLILWAGWVFAKKVRPNFRKMQKARGELSAQLQDSFSGMHETQAFGQQERATRQVTSICLEIIGNFPSQRRIPDCAGYRYCGRLWRIFCIQRHYRRRRNRGLPVIFGFVLCADYQCCAAS